MSTNLTVGVGQCPAGLDGGAARLDWLAQELSQHKGLPLDLVILPELFQCGYNTGDRILDRAEASDGPFAEAVARLAQEMHTAILYGYAERQGDRLFNSAQCIDQSGDMIGHHRKLLLPPGLERNYFTPSDGGCTSFQLGGFTVAILVCYDVEFPENVRHIAVTGTDIIAVPTALGAQWGVVAERIIPARAFENGVFLCYTNYCGTENGLTYFGGSCIVAPDGKDLARASDTSGLLTATLRKGAVAAAQVRLPYHTDRLRLPWVYQNP